MNNPDPGLNIGQQKKIIFSGIQPTGTPTLGSLIGALKNWSMLSAEYDCLFCSVDLHSISVRHDPEDLRRFSRELIAWYIAVGLDPVENILYIQSHVPAHAELSWILGCYTYLGELNRMTQYKEKSARHVENINAGLYTYPVLQAADILLYQTDLVPVGEDQRQHLELSRDIAQRFNQLYGDIFTMPEAYIGKVGARIMGLQVPDKKMSKSEGDNENNLVYLSDAPEQILKKFKRAVTDSDSTVRFAAEEKPGISNLLSIYTSVTGKTIAESEADFTGVGYGGFKTAVGEAVVDYLAPVQKKFKEVIDDKSYLDNVIKEGASRARLRAEVTLEKVKDAIGFQMVCKG